MTGVLENNFVSIQISGVVSGIGAALFWAVYLMSSKKSINSGKHTFTILFYSVIFISIVLIPFTNFNQINDFISIDPLLTTIFLITHSTFSFALPYVLSTLSLNYIDSGISSIILSGAEPLAALMFGFLIYCETPSVLMFCGFILTIISIIILSKKTPVKN